MRRATRRSPSGSRHRSVRPVHPGDRTDRPDGAAVRRQTVGGRQLPRRVNRRCRRVPRRQSRQPPSSIVDGGWPRLYDLPSGGTMLVYQPQVASWDKQTHLVAFSAVSYRAKAGDKPAIGTIKIEADTQVAARRPAGQLSEDEDRRGELPDAAERTGARDHRDIDKAIPDDERVIALDRVLANLDKSQIVPKNVEGVKADPPTIFFSKTPAVIVNLDGEPIWSPIKDNDLKFAVNTNWDLFQHVPTNTFTCATTTRG